MIELNSIELENIRGFSSTYLDLTNDKIVFVGRNNSGKTSVLLLLDWLINKCDRKILEGSIEPDHVVSDVLIPARETRNQARRLSLYVKILDGRKWRKYGCDKNGIARLRIGLRLSPKCRLFAKLGNPSKGETLDSDPVAIQILELIQDSFYFVHIPSFRDVRSSRFQDTLTNSFRALLEERALHNRQGGAPAEYRAIKSSERYLREVAEELASPLLNNISSALPADMIKDAKIKLDCGPEDIVAWLSERLRLKLSTGKHDSDFVAPLSVGSGLQSLLELAIHSTSKDDGKQWILAIEEPEAFLHPSAQRLIARQIFSDESMDKLLITTHSSLVVDEAQVNHIVITSEHRFYRFSNTDIHSINVGNSLLRHYGAEMMFSRGVLLVEGESDRQFFEEIRRRLSRYDDEGYIDQMIVIPVGSKDRFGPWLRLLKSFSIGGEYPISWLVLADADGARAIHKSFTESIGSLPLKLADRITALQHVYDEKTNINDWYRHAKAVNKLAQAEDVRLRVLPVDLESATLESVSDATCQLISEFAKIEFNDKDSLLRRLGSKGVNFKSSDNKLKSPHVRGYFGQILPKDEISSDLKNILMAWMMLVMPHKKAKELYDSFG